MWQDMTNLPTLGDWATDLSLVDIASTYAAAGVSATPSELVADRGA